MKNCLTIAGSDCSGGAGIQADLKTFSALGCYGMSAISAVVAENTERVISTMPVTPSVIYDQLEAVFTDIRVDAVKIGMLPGRWLNARRCGCADEIRPGDRCVRPYSRRHRRD